MPSACEVDICGVVGMYALQLASGTPSALLDWNNNYGDDPEQGRLFPLQQPAQAFLPERAHGFPGDHRRHGGQGEHLRHLRGPREGRADELRALLHQRREGRSRGYVGEGRFTNDPLETFGGYGVVEIPRMQDLLHYICRNGFEHHVAANSREVAPMVHEARTRYLGLGNILAQA